VELDASRQRLLLGCERLLAPIIRFLIKGGVSWKEFSELSKGVFVQVATADFGIRGRPTNASRVAILTGLDRREVRRQREALAAQEITVAGYVTKGSQVLGGWHHDSAYLGPDRQPRALPVDGASPCFADLVRQYAPGLPAVAMLKELKAAGAVEEQPGGTFLPLKRSYIPTQMPEEKVRLWSTTIRDLASAVGYNFTRPPKAPALFERRAVNLNVDASVLPEFKVFLEAEGQAFLERVDDWLAAHELRGAGGGGKAIRVGAGVYQIQDDPSDK
jgi:hypothetical protein